MAEDRVSRFLEMLKFPNQKEKQMREFKRIPDHELVQPLVDIVYSTDDIQTRKTAIQFLGEMERQYVLKELVDLITSDVEKELRVTAIQVLGNMRDKTALSSLEKVVNRSDDKDIIQAASIAVQVIQGITETDSQDLN